MDPAPILISQSSIDQIASNINVLITIFKAIGGVIIVWLVFQFINWKRQSKQKELLIEISQKLDKIAKNQKGK